jgi:hypothetical protein
MEASFNRGLNYFSVHQDHGNTIKATRQGALIEMGILTGTK